MDTESSPVLIGQTETVALAYHESLTSIARIDEDIPTDASEVAAYGESLRGLVDDNAADARAIGQKHNYPDQWLNYCEHAVHAFLDEVVVNHKRARDFGIWSQKDQNAGETYFTHLNELTAQKTNTKQLGDVLSLFALCMELGFRGLRSHEDVEMRLIAITARIEICGFISPPVSEYPRLPEAKRDSANRAPFLIGVLAALLLLLVYAVMAVTLNSKADEVKASLAEVQARP
ncbi:MAG: DotU family type IV/VI secretion system protein [Acidobacteriaceae bacterium]|nr:DotU family type IV/VI secretion system protein [Acidobacteriaceae bacterium]MBV9296417.1 DotU family type IV/VI secretion system protein [Acidobacteriaceae bacterium]MBV9764371.1 DotU family type IV/VI secretion system protein [Acidobacteriaceae bacterium]